MTQRRTAATASNWYAGTAAAMLVGLLLAGVGPGVYAASSAGTNEVTIKNVRFNFLRSPKYGETTDGRAKSEYDWLQIQAEYESSGGRDGWIDEVTFEWAVLVPRQQGRNFLLRKSVSYVDIGDGKHYADIYIRPGFMRRYGDNKRLREQDLRVHVLVRINGVKAETFRFPRERGSSEWWTEEPPKVSLREGELLSRGETPFAPLDYDFYEHAKPSTKAASE